MKSFIVYGIIIGFICSGVQSLEFSNCGSPAGTFKKITVSECDTTKSACILKRNTNATITIEFASKIDSNDVKAICHGVIMGVEMPFPLPNGNGCVNSGISCPISTGTSYVYTATLPVLKAYPKVKVDVKWELKASNGDDLVCVLIPAKIE